MAVDRGLDVEDVVHTALVAVAERAAGGDVMATRLLLDTLTSEEVRPTRRVAVEVVGLASRVEKARARIALERGDVAGVLTDDDDRGDDHDGFDEVLQVSTGIDRDAPDVALPAPLPLPAPPPEPLQQQDDDDEPEPTLDLPPGDPLGGADPATIAAMLRRGEQPAVAKWAAEIERAKQARQQRNDDLPRWRKMTESDARPQRRQEHDPYKGM